MRIDQLALGRVSLPDFHPAAPGFDDIYAFLVRDPTSCILIDTGVGVGNTLIDRLYRPESVDLAAALAGVGASLGDVTAVVNSHLHFDHCGNNPLFPGVPIFVQEAELEAARAKGYTVPEWIEFPGANLEPVRGSYSISPHIELLPTPGHAPGHQSVIVRRRGGVEIVAAQSAYSAAEFQLFVELDPSDTALQPHLDLNASWSRSAYVASLSAIQELDPRRVLFSHDAQAWERAA